MLTLRHVSKIYPSGGTMFSALRDVSLDVAAGEMCAIMGRSGAGKSTLMNMIGLLDKPTSGTITIAGSQVTAASADELASLRSRLIGFVFQSFHLIPTLSVIENIAMPLIYRRQSMRQAKVLAAERLAWVGLGGHGNKRPNELSGGQRQRVAIARALVGCPSILLADEPTGALDNHTGREVLDLFERMNAENAVTIVMITHDSAVAKRCRRIVTIEDGRIVGDSMG